MTTVTDNELNKLNYPLMTISPRYCNRLHNDPHLNPMKKEVKEDPTAIFWGIYINLQTEMHKVRTLLAKTLLLTCKSFSKSLTKASEELWPAPHRCFPTVVIIDLCFRSSTRERVRRTTVLIFTHHQLAPSVGTSCF